MEGSQGNTVDHYIHTSTSNIQYKPVYGWIFEHTSSGLEEC